MNSLIDYFIVITFYAIFFAIINKKGSNDKKEEK